MARPFPKGQSGNPKGRPVGAKDKLPRTAKRAVAGLIERFGQDTDLLADVIRKGLMARAPSSFPYLRLLIEQNVGAPEQVIDVRDALSRKMVDEIHPGPTKTR